jgi:hypothetical protein
MIVLCGLRMGIRRSSGLFFESDEKGEAVIRLQPRNEKYRAQTIVRSEITGLYKAVFKYQKVDEE